MKYILSILCIALLFIVACSTQQSSVEQDPLSNAMLVQNAPDGVQDTQVAQEDALQGTDASSETGDTSEVTYLDDEVFVDTVDDEALVDLETAFSDW